MEIFTTARVVRTTDTGVNVAPDRVSAYNPLSKYLQPTEEFVPPTELCVQLTE